MAVSEQEAKVVKDALSQKYLFNQAAGLPVNGLATSLDDNGDHFVMIFLKRALTVAEEAQLPKVQDGVTVKHQVIGNIRPS